MTILPTIEPRLCQQQSISKNESAQNRSHTTHFTRKRKTKTSHSTSYKNRRKSKFSLQKSQSTTSLTMPSFSKTQRINTVSRKNVTINKRVSQSKNLSSVNIFDKDDFSNLEAFDNENFIHKYKFFNAKNKTSKAQLKSYRAQSQKSNIRQLQSAVNDVSNDTVLCSSKNQWIDAHQIYANQVPSINALAHLSIDTLNQVVQSESYYLNAIQSINATTNMTAEFLLPSSKTGTPASKSMPTIQEHGLPKKPQLERRTSLLGSIDALDYYKRQQRYNKMKRQAFSNSGAESPDVEKTQDHKLSSSKSKDDYFTISSLFSRHFEHDSGHYTTGMPDNSCRAALCIDLLMKISHEVPSYAQLIQFIAKQLSKYIFEPPTLLQQNFQKQNETRCMGRENCYERCKEHETNLLSASKSARTLPELTEKQSKSEHWFDKQTNCTIENLSKLPLYHDKQIETKLRISDASVFLKKLELARMFDVNIYQSRAALTHAKTIFHAWKKRARDRRRREFVIKTLTNKNRRDWKIFRTWKHNARETKKRLAVLNADVAKAEIIRLHSEISHAKISQNHSDKETQSLRTGLATTTDFIKAIRGLQCHDCKDKQTGLWDDLIQNLKLILGSYRALIECGIVESVEELRQTAAGRPSFVNCISIDAYDTQKNNHHDHDHDASSSTSTATTETIITEFINDVCDDKGDKQSTSNKRLSKQKFRSDKGGVCESVDTQSTEMSQTSFSVVSSHTPSKHSGIIKFGSTTRSF